MYDQKDSSPITQVEENELKRKDEHTDVKKPIQNGIAFSNETGFGEVTLSKQHVDSHKYPYKSGIAVIINNIEFDRRLNLPDRKGSDVDASVLYQRFQELGFESDMMNDASSRDIEEKFNEIKEDKKSLKQADCLAVVLLTHGNEDHVYATDREIKIKNLMDKFNAENCPELIMKPKIFIFQACRGSGIGTGLNVKVIRDLDPNQPDAAGEYSEYDAIHGETIRIPNEADYLAVYATSSGYGAFRNTEKGSPFVKYLSEEIRDMKEDEDFYRVLTRVNRKVGTGYKPNCRGGNNNFTQMPCFISHLTKDLILKTKPKK